jgi:hypothetical protein
MGVPRERHEDVGARQQEDGAKDDQPFSFASLSDAELMQ